MPPLPPLPYDILEQTFFISTSLEWLWLTLRPASAFLKRLIEPQIVDQVFSRLQVRLTQVDPSVKPEWLHIEPSLQPGQILNAWRLVRPQVSGDHITFDVQESNLEACECRLWSEQLCNTCNKDATSWSTASPGAVNTLLETMNTGSHWLVHAYTIDSDGSYRTKLAQFEAFHTRLPPSPASPTSISLPWRPLLTYLLTHQFELDSMFSSTRTFRGRLNSSIAPPGTHHQCPYETVFEKTTDFHRAIHARPWSRRSQARRTMLRRAAARAILSPCPATMHTLADPVAARCDDPQCTGCTRWQVLTSLVPSIVHLVRARWAYEPTRPPNNAIRFVVDALAEPRRWTEHGYGWFPRRAGLYKGAVEPSLANKAKLQYHRAWEREGILLGRDEVAAQVAFDGIQWKKRKDGQGYWRFPMLGYGELEGPGSVFIGEEAERPGWAPQEEER